MRLKRQKQQAPALLVEVGEALAALTLLDPMDEPMFEVSVNEDHILVVRDSAYHFRLGMQRHDAGQVWVVQEVSLEDDVLPEIVLSSEILMTYSGYNGQTALHFPVKAEESPEAVCMSFQEHAWQTFCIRAKSGNLRDDERATAHLRAARVQPAWLWGVASPYRDLPDLDAPYA